MSLPHELLDNIFSFLPPSDLLACSRTSSAFAHVAQRQLFRHISVGVTTKSALIVLLLAKNPRLARCVRTFQMRFNPHLPVFKSFHDALATALANMTGLTSLELHLGFCSSSVLRKATLNPDILYPRLRQFSCSLPLDATVVGFLSKAPNLDSLSLDHIPVSVDLPPCIPSTVTPYLTQFAGPLHAALALVPGRSLVSVQLHDGDLTEDIVQALAGSSSSLLLLSASTSSPPLPILKSISNSMNKLMYLRLMSTRNFFDVPDRVGFQRKYHASSANNFSDIFPSSCRCSLQHPWFNNIWTLWNVLELVQAKDFRKWRATCLDNSLRNHVLDTHNVHRSRRYGAFFCLLSSRMASILCRHTLIS